MSTGKKGNYYEKNTLKDFPLMVIAIMGMGIDIIGKDDKKWFKIGYCIADAFGEDGRRGFHEISQQCATYSEVATDEKYNNCLLSIGKYNINIGFLFFLVDQAFYKETGMSFNGFMRYVHK